MTHYSPMSPPRSRVRIAVVDRWLPVRMDWARSIWDALSAGAIPNARPVMSASPATAAATGQSIEVCTRPGVEDGNNDLKMERAPIPEENSQPATRKRQHHTLR